MGQPAARQAPFSPSRAPRLLAFLGSCRSATERDRAFHPEQCLGARTQGSWPARCIRQYASSWIDPKPGEDRKRILCGKSYERNVQRSTACAGLVVFRLEVFPLTQVLILEALPDSSDWRVLLYETRSNSKKTF